MANTYISIPVPAGNGTGAAVDVSALSSNKTIQVNGTFSGAIQLEVSNDGGATFTEAIVITRAGKYKINQAVQFIRAERRNVDSNVPGSATVSIGAETTTQFLQAVLNVPATNTAGTSTDLTDFGSFNTVIVDGNFQGALILEISEDGGATWIECMTFTGAGLKTKTFSAQFIRVRRSGIDPVAPPGTPVAALGALPDESEAGGGGGGGGSPEWNVRFISSVDTAAIGDLMACDPSSAGFAVNLPASSAGTAGQSIRIKNDSDSTNVITITPDGSDTIDGAATFAIAVARASVDLVDDGTGNWLVS